MWLKLSVVSACLKTKSLHIICVRLNPVFSVFFGSL